MEKKGDPQNQPRLPKYGPVMGANFLSEILFFPSFYMQVKSMCTPLSENELFNIPKGMHPQHNVNQYQTCQKQMSKTSKSDFKRVFFGGMVLCNLIVGALLAVLAACLGFAGPIVIKNILAFISKKNATLSDQTQAYTYVAIWVVLYFLRIFVSQNTQHVFNRMSIKAEQVLSSLIFSKILRMSSSYKKFLQKGDILNHLTNDVRCVRSSISSMSHLFAAPATLIAVQTLLFIQVGYYGFALVGVFLFGGVIQYILDTKMSQIRVKKLNLMEERLGTNLELLTSIKHLKLLGWQKLLVAKNSEFVKSQNQFNNKYFGLECVFDLINNVCPTLAILAIFVAQIIKDDGGGFDTVSVYTMISIVNMVYSPVRQLFGQIIKTLDGLNAIKRIDHLLDAEQMLPFVPNSKLQPGELIVNDLEMNWQTDESIMHFKKREELSAIVKQEKSLEKDVVEYPIEQDCTLQNTADNLCVAKEQAKKPYAYKTFSVREINIKLVRGDRLVILGQSNSGKTTFINAILGNVHIQSGEVQYGGTVGYVSQKLWFRNMSVKDNVLMGRKQNRKLLEKVYGMVQLTMQLWSLSQRDNTKMSEANYFSQGQKRRIAIARALYGQPDILLLDDALISLDNQTSKKIYDNICNQFPNSTIIMSTHTASVIRPHDKVLIFENGAAREYATYATLMKAKSSLLGKLIQTLTEVNQNSINLMEERQKMHLQKMQEKCKINQWKAKLKDFVKNLKKVKHLSAQQFTQHLNQKSVQKQASKAPKRVPGVPLSVYKVVLACAKVQYAVSLTIITYGLKVYSDWYIGQVKKITDYPDSTKLLLYSGLIFGFACLFSLTAIVNLLTSHKVTDKISQKACKSLAYANLSWFLQQKPLKIAGKINKVLQIFTQDYEQTYRINNCVQNIFKNMTFLIATLVLVGLNAPILYSLSAGIMIVNSLLLICYLNAQREIYKSGVTITDNLNQYLDQAIGGIDYIRAYNKIQSEKTKFTNHSYTVSMFRTNYQAIQYALTIVSQMMSLLLMACVAYLAVSDKFKADSDVSLIGLTITFSMKIADQMSSLIRDIAKLQLQMKINIKPQQQIFDKNQEQRYDTPLKPVGWPENGSICFENVSLLYPMFTVPGVKDISFSVKSGENVVLCGSEESGKGLILSSIARLVEPVSYKDAINQFPEGRILISGVNIKEVGHITQHVMYLNSTPFIYTASIRQNIDPFQSYTDDQIKEALVKVKLWDNIQVECEESINQKEAKLGFILKDAGANLSVGILQKLNIARALIRKPRILLCESATSALDPVTEQQVSGLIKRQFKDSTLIQITENISPILESDRVIFLANGKIKESDQPLKLLCKKDGLFSAMVQTLEPNLHQGIITKLHQQIDPLTMKAAVRKSRMFGDLCTLLEYLG